MSEFRIVLLFDMIGTRLSSPPNRGAGLVQLPFSSRKKPFLSTARCTSDHLQEKEKAPHRTTHQVQKLRVETRILGRPVARDEGFARGELGVSIAEGGALRTC